MDYYIPKGDEIKALRVKNKLSQVDCADLTCVSVNTWSRWEAGRHLMPAGIWKLFKNEVNNVYRRPQEISLDQAFTNLTKSTS